MRFWATSAFGLAGCLYSSFALKWRRNFLQVKAQPPCQAHYCDTSDDETPLADFPATPDLYAPPLPDTDTPISPVRQTRTLGAKFALQQRKPVIKKISEFPEPKDPRRRTSGRAKFAEYKKTPETECRIPNFQTSGPFYPSPPFPTSPASSESGPDSPASSESGPDSPPSPDRDSPSSPDLDAPQFGFIPRYPSSPASSNPSDSPYSPDRRRLAAYGPESPDASYPALQLVQEYPTYRDSDCLTSSEASDGELSMIENPDRLKRGRSESRVMSSYWEPDDSDDSEDSRPTKRSRIDTLHLSSSSKHSYEDDDVKPARTGTICLPSSSDDDDAVSPQRSKRSKRSRDETVDLVTSPEDSVVECSHETKPSRTGTICLSSSSEDDDAECSQRAKPTRPCTPHPAKSAESRRPYVLTEDKVITQLRLVGPLRVPTPPPLKWQFYSHGGKIFPYPKIAKRWLIENDDFLICYDNNTRTACWTLEEIRSDKLTQERTIEPRLDKEQMEIPIDFRTSISDYEGYKAQHLAEHDLHPGLPGDLCVCSNVVAQRVKNGDYGAKTIWEELRSYVAWLSRNYDSVYVLTGPLYLPKREDDGRWTVNYEVIGGKRIAVPTHFFKVILVKQRWNKHFRLECYKFENKCHEVVDLRKFVVTRKSLEKDAGFLIFNQVEDKVVDYTFPDRYFTAHRYYTPRRLCFENVAS